MCFTGSVCGDSSRISSSVTDDVSVDNSSNESEGVACSRISPGGNSYYVPVVDAVFIPYADQRFESLDKCFKFYKEYGRYSGFDVRKGCDKKDEHGTTILKHFVCSREGFNELFRGKVVKGRRTVSRRCGCKARIVVKLVQLNSYAVFNFVEEHNHPLVEESCRQFLKVNREMTMGLRSIVFDAAKVNIGCSKSFSLAKEMYGGYSNVGATLRDFRNFNRDLKEYVGEKDGQMIIDKFKVMQETSSSFYYAYDVDSAGHLTKLFWADPVGRKNFEIFGDAVSFDATFDTNKYNMVFAPFTGVDKHDRCVTFAACLLSHESVSDYSWAFEQLVKAMGRNPVIIITDQCPAVKVAVPAVFSDANGLLGNRLCKETGFMEKLKKFIWSSILEIDEFEKGWEEVIKEFKLEGNKWLQDIYEIRSSWIPAYFRNDPMFGLLRTTSRSESENFFFSQFHRQGDSLCEFWIRYQSAMDRQRNERKRLDNESNSSVPTSVSTWFIEDDAAKLFTRSIFYKVQEEIIASCLDMQIKRMSDEVDGVTNFEIRDVKVQDKLFKVSVSRNHVVCSCKKFVMCGIVCRHSFCGLKHIGVTKFPRSLVLNRWMKIAESGTSLSSVSNDYFKMEHVSMKLTDICQGVVVDFTKRDHMAAMVGEEPEGDLTVLAPNVCKNKGNFFKRLISEREKAVIKSKKRIRKCKECSAVTHDLRTCPNRKKGDS
ncbi:protein FAR1-RELATED SEQUENCE 5-like [Daucus carota subsp. sativus]|uniref:protein FAR1-RELATED SEQUENCE 5-like n=1 Tax=Daucus carota subsp. sativus TaxID=79200 RepID=UPI003083BAEB